MKKAFVLSIIGILLLAACKKSDTVENTQNDCSISREHISEGNASTPYSLSYSYTGDKVTKMEFSTGEYSIFEYEGNNMVKISRRCSGASSCYLDEVLSYNSDGTLKSIDSYIAGSFGNIIKSTSSQFFYTNGKITKVIEYFINRNNPADSSIVSVSNFTYTNSNITKLESEDVNGEKHIFNFSYGNKKNYLNDAYKGNWLLYTVHSERFNVNVLPDILSANNVTKVTIQSSRSPIETAVMNYKLDNKGILAELLIETDPTGYNAQVKYEYKCP